MAACVEEMPQFIHTTEQEHMALTTQQQELEERTKRKAAEAIQAA